MSSWTIHEVAHAPRTGGMSAGRKGVGGREQHRAKGGWYAQGVSADRLTAALTLRVSARLSGNNRTQQNGRLINNRNVLLTVLGAGSPRLGHQGGQGRTL